jgi:hypothetical protein
MANRINLYPEKPAGTTNSFLLLVTGLSYSIAMLA